jgi:hypothetical protein
LKKTNFFSETSSQFLIVAKITHVEVKKPYLNLVEFENHFKTKIFKIGQ